MIKKKYQRNISAEELAMAERAMETGSPVMDRDGHKATLVKIDRENPEFAYLLRYGTHSLSWIGAGEVTFPEDEE